MERGRNPLSLNIECLKSGLISFLLLRNRFGQSNLLFFSLCLDGDPSSFLVFAIIYLNCMCHRLDTKQLNIETRTSSTRSTTTAHTIATISTKLGWLLGYFFNFCPSSKGRGWGGGVQRGGGISLKSEEKGGKRGGGRGRCRKRVGGIFGGRRGP